MDTYQIVSRHPLLAIMRNIPLDKTIDYAETIVRGGVNFFEVALNSKDGLQQIRLLRDHFGDDCIIGAGTAISIDRVKAAVDAGAQFLLTPGTPPSVLEYCAANDLLLLPGVLTPCDVALCLEYGFHTMKLFPAGDMPMKYVKDLKGPFDSTNYMAIGGVSPDNIQDFFQAGYISVGLSSNMMPKDILTTEDWNQGIAYVQDLTRKINLVQNIIHK